MFEMLQVRKNEISLRQWSGGGAAQLCTLEGTLVAKYVGSNVSFHVV